MLLNTGMNFAAKHLLTIFNSNSAELLKTNSKILEEIIERALKYYRKKETLDCAQMIEFILTVRKLPDCFSLLALQRKNLFSKKINCMKILSSVERENREGRNEVITS